MGLGATQSNFLHLCTNIFDTVVCFYEFCSFKGNKIIKVWNTFSQKVVKVFLSDFSALGIFVKYNE